MVAVDLGPEAMSNLGGAATEARLTERKASWSPAATNARAAPACLAWTEQQ